MTASDMDNVQKAQSFLKECGTYYLATVDGSQPHVRPFGTADVYEGKLYIQTGKVKDVYRQLEANPKAEICAMHPDGRWIRIRCELVPDDRLEAKAYMLDMNPSLKAIYKADDGNTIVLYLKDATATISSFKSAPETFNF